MLSSWLIAILLISPFLYAGYVYNQLVKRRNQVREAWSGIDVQLKRRHNLIPNLVTTVKSYARHEKDVLEEITELRRRISDPGNVKETGAKENNISKSLKTLLGLVEAYPELKADKNFLTLQNELVDIAWSEMHLSTISVPRGSHQAAQAQSKAGLAKCVRRLRLMDLPRGGRNPHY